MRTWAAPSLHMNTDHQSAAAAAVAAADVVHECHSSYNIPHLLHNYQYDPPWNQSEAIKGLQTYVHSEF